MAEKLEAKVKVKINLPEALWKKTRMQAIREDRDAQDIIRDGLKLYFERRQKQPADAGGGA